MKKYSTIILIIAAFGIFTSCGESTSEDMSSDDFHFTVKIDGTEYTNSDAIVSANPDQDGELFKISGNKIPGEDSWIVLNLIGPTREGTFTVPSDEISLFHTTDSRVWGANFEGGSGTITISKNTAEYMIGIFFFTGVNLDDNSVMEFTEGSFKAEKF